MTSGGQSITDRALAAKHTVAGQTLAKSVCKATTEEIISPKRKHLDHLLRCTNDPSISIPQMANILIERTQNSSWVVVFKALVTVHTLMNHGNERFTQYLASNNCTFHLDSFYDRSNGMQGYGMSTFIRQYAKYLTQKSYSYRQMAFDFCRAKRGKEDGVLRNMNADELLKALPLIQTQFDALVGFEVAAVQITNGIISAAFMLLFRDLIRLYACYNDGIINLLGRYFDLNKKSCREAFEIYKLFIARVDKVGQFLKVAENIGVDRGEIPDLAKAPASLLDALEQHLNAFENTKKATMTTSVGRSVPCSPAGRTSSKAPRTTSATETVRAASVSPSVGRPLPTYRPVVISETERKQILEEEERMLVVIKQQNIKHLAAVGKSAAAAAAAASSAPASTRPPNVDAQKLAVIAQTEFNPFDQLDHGFDLPPVPPSHDLLDLQQWSPPSQPVPTANGASIPGDDGLFFQSLGILNPSPVLSAKSNPADLFGSSTFSGFDPMKTSSTSPALMLQARLTPSDFGAPASPHALHLGGAGAGSATRLPAEAEMSRRLITSDLDASLATIVGNLSVGTPEHYRRTDHNWTGPIERRLTGAGAGAAVAGNTWTPGSSSQTMYPSGRPAALNMGGAQSTALATGSQYPAMMTAYPVVMGQPMTVMGSAPQESAMFVSHSASDTKSATTTLPPNDPFGFL